jgi:hypothetical protein
MSKKKRSAPKKPASKPPPAGEPQPATPPPDNPLLRQEESEADRAGDTQAAARRLKALEHDKQMRSSEEVSGEDQ